MPALWPAALGFVAVLMLPPRHASADDAATTAEASSATEVADAPPTRTPADDRVLTPTAAATAATTASAPRAGVPVRPDDAAWRAEVLRLRHDQGLLALRGVGAFFLVCGVLCPLVAIAARPGPHAGSSGGVMAGFGFAAIAGLASGPVMVGIGAHRLRARARRLEELRRMGPPSRRQPLASLQLYLELDSASSTVATTLRLHF